MIQQAVNIFDSMKPMLKKLKKDSYESNMKEFRKKYDILFDEILLSIEKKENREEAAKELAVNFCESVKEKFSVRGKIKGVLQMDLNMFMIYYVFPAILFSYRDPAKLFADQLCETWGNVFKDSKIGYADYDTIYNSFQEKIFGIF